MFYLVAFLSLWGLAASQPGTPIYEYVNMDDGMYSYQELYEINQNGFTSYVINMTSQKWFDEALSDNPIWYHYVTIHIPMVLDPAFSNNAFLYIGTGSWDDNPPDAGSRHVRETGIYANRTGMVTAVIKQIPFQPIKFNDSLTDRSEDAIISYTWMKYIENNNTAPEILLRFPMCKAVSKAMDAITTLAAEKTGGTVNVDSFMVAGESKRGWTTWLMPVVDERIVAIAPVVLSALNLNANMHHYWRAFGAWTFAFANYWLEGLTSYIDSPDIFRLMEQIDPYTYRNVLTVPKLMVSGASDEFFMPDDYDYFYDDLVGEKYIWMLENTGHGVSGSPLNEEYWTMLETFYIAIIKNRPRPSVSWTRFVDPTTGDGYITVTLGEAANSVVAWSADTPPAVAPRRDFRGYMLKLSDGDIEVPTNITWYESPATDLGNNVWRVDFAKPDEGYRAFFLKVNIPYPEEGRDFTFTTQVQILSFDPTTPFPFPDCTLEGCAGLLV